MHPNFIILIFIFSFICSYIDCSLGMGYGTLLSPILLLFGFNILMIIPILLLSQLIQGLFVSIFNQKFKNLNFKQIGGELNILAFIVIIGISATIIARIFILMIPNQLIMVYIGILLFFTGFLLLQNKKFALSKKKLKYIVGLGAFNKAISGGGFGPLVTMGQILSGRDIGNSVAITSFVEIFISAFGFLLYLPFIDLINLNLVIIVITGGILATPIGALQIKRYNKQNRKYVIGIMSISLGIIIILKNIIGF